MKVSRLFLISSSISLLYCILTICFIDYLSVPWTDEIGTADTAINVVLYGQWKSDVWLYIYQPLHAFFLIPWIFIFGISHTSVCSMNVIIAFISSCYSMDNNKDGIDAAFDVMNQIFSDNIYKIC